jgi:hypothetical protein
MGLVGQPVPDEQHLPMTCDTHTVEEIEAAHQRWQARNDPELGDEKEDGRDGAQWTIRIIMKY